MGSKSSSSTAATTTSYYDQRQVVDAGGGIVGTGNQWDQSVTAVDGRSFASTTTTNATDNSVHTVTDAGAIAAGSAASRAAMDLAIRAQESAAAFDAAAASKSFDLARSSQAAAADANANALAWAGSRVDDVLGMARDLAKSANAQASAAAGVAQSAYQGAADSSSGNRTLVLAAVGAVAAVAVVAAFKG